MFKKILVPCDGSSCSQKAFSVALKLATKFDGQIILITVIWFSPSPYKFFMSREGSQESLVLLPDAGNEAFVQHQDLKSEASRLGVKLESIIEQDAYPPKAIISCAKRYNANIIVMGSKGKSGWEKLCLGSVTEKVVQRAVVPVLVVK